MRKSILFSSLLVFTLVIGGCSSKEVVSKNTGDQVSDVARHINKVDTTNNKTEASKESKTDMETEETTEVETEETTEVESTVESLVDSNDETEATEVDMSFLNESVGEPTVLNEGLQNITLARTDNLYELPEIMGYKMKAVRPFDYYEIEADGLNDYSKILSGEWWSGNAIFHDHVINESEVKPGYYYDDAHEGPCYITESIHVQVYPKDLQDEGWTYDDGEDLSNWFDDSVMGNAIGGDDSRIEKVKYSVNGKEWTVCYGQRNLLKDAKDDFSTIYCEGYFKEDNGDYVYVELQHNNYPTIRTDNHVPSAEERMNTAKEEFETIISTFEKVQ